jgi:hypothetical protein
MVAFDPDHRIEVGARRRRHSPAARSFNATAQRRPKSSRGGFAWSCCRMQASNGRLHQDLCKTSVREAAEFKTR